MKQLLFILSLFLSLAVSAQKYPADFNTYGVHYPRGNFDKALHIPTIQDTVSVRDNSIYRDSAEVAIFQGALWFKPANGYWRIASGGGSSGGNSQPTIPANAMTTTEGETLTTTEGETIIFN